MLARLPLCRFFNPTATTIWDASWKLTSLNQILWQCAIFVSNPAQFDGGCALGIGRRYVYRNPLVREKRLDARCWWHQIRIATHDDESIATVIECVVEHLHGNVNVGTFLFHRLEMTIACISAITLPTPDLFFFEFTHNNRDQWERIHRTQKTLLSLTCFACNACAKIVNPLHVVVGQQSLKERLQIKPFVGGILQRAIVEIETVDIDDTANSVRFTHRHSRNRKSGF